MHSPPLPDKSTTKGRGLKKWRRIKRDFVKDQTTALDSCKILKRGLPDSANPTKPQHMASTEIKQNSEPHIGPVNISKNTNVAREFMMHSASSDSRFAVGAACAAATNSENSEDQSSQSSTAASMPKVRYDPSTVLGYMDGKNHMKNLSGNIEGNSSQGIQQGKGCVESSKKLRGERVRIEKDNSQSSIESDSTSSNFGFMLGSFSTTSYTKKSKNSMSRDGRNGDEAHEDLINGEVRTAYRKENPGEIEEISLDDLAGDLSWKAKEGKTENGQLSPNQDPLVKSLISLRSLQESLESELQKFAEIGMEPASLDDGSVHVDSTFADQEASSSDQLDSEKIRRTTSDSSETQLFILTHKVKYLESKLEEARAVLLANESKISELETTVNSSRSRMEEPGSTTELQQEKYKEMEFDLDALFLQRMEAEIQFLALTRAVQKLRVSVDNNQIRVFEEQTSFVGRQAQLLNKLGDAESKASTTLKKQTDALEKYCGDASGTDEVLKMQRRVFKVTTYFFTQLVLLVLVFLFVVLEFSSQSGMIIPT